jgi:hypothetical protein
MLRETQACQVSDVRDLIQDTSRRNKSGDQTSFLGISSKVHVSRNEIRSIGIELVFMLHLALRAAEQTSFFKNRGIIAVVIFNFNLRKIAAGTTANDVYGSSFHFMTIARILTRA